jgi:hypothetical protein
MPSLNVSTRLEDQAFSRLCLRWHVIRAPAVLRFANQLLWSCSHTVVSDRLIVVKGLKRTNQIKLSELKKNRDLTSLESILAGFYEVFGPDTAAIYMYLHSKSPSTLDFNTRVDRK